LKKDFDQILKGITLEDGAAGVDVLAYADSKGQNTDRGGNSQRPESHCPADF
jgi:hypothetical protein